MKNNRGFTLIELLVTIAIISLLSSIVFASLSSARDKAVVAKKVAQIKEVEKAVELSRLASGSLPINTKTVPVSELSFESSFIQEVGEYISPNILLEDSGGDINKEYYYVSDGEDAVDEYGNYFFCGLRGGFYPEDNVMFYADDEVMTQEFWGNDWGLSDEIDFFDGVLFYRKASGGDLVSDTNPDFVDYVSTSQLRSYLRPTTVNNIIINVRSDRTMLDIPFTASNQPNMIKTGQNNYIFMPYQVDENGVSHVFKCN